MAHLSVVSPLLTIQLPKIRCAPSHIQIQTQNTSVGVHLLNEYCATVYPTDYTVFYFVFCIIPSS